MCEYSGRLIAWLDQELPDQEAAHVEWHVAQCAECRQALSAYQEVSAAFLSCYEGTMAIPPQRKTKLWVGGGLAAAAAMLAAIFIPLPPAEKISFHPPSPPPAPIVTAGTPVHARRHSRPALVRRQWIAEEPTVQVALPADALFPPGAVPQGFSFIADVRFQQ
jgi:anti-sigma factor RsiW